jgi:hypothetical protein
MPNQVKHTSNPPSQLEKMGWILFVFISQFVALFMLFELGSNGSSIGIGIIFALFGALMLTAMSLGISRARLNMASRPQTNKETGKSPVHSILNAPQSQSDSILESVSDGIVVTDQTGKITVLNNSAAQIADIVIYASPAKGHINGQDMLRLSNLLSLLPAPENECKNFPTLGNLFIVATHADPSISNEELQKIPSGAARRLYKQLNEGVLKNRRELINRDISQQDLQSRFFTFWSEM